MDSKRKKPAESLPEQKPKRARKLALAACNNCRRMKRRCDNLRPTCTYCQNSRQTCEYDTDYATESRSQAIKRRHKSIESSQELLKDSIHWLRAQSQETAMSCLERLRHAGDPTAELCLIASTERTKQLPPQIPPEEALFAMSPSVNSMLDIELSMTHPGSFPMLPTNPPVLPQGPHPEFVALSDLQYSEYPSKPHALPARPSHLPLLEHINHRGLCDSRLLNIKIRYWTTVPISDGLAADLLSTLLRVEQPVYGFFQPDLFIRDLVGQEDRFCSSLLVNAVLFWSSCTFGPTFPAASAFTDGFLSAAQHLLEAELASDNDLTLASLAILSISMICFGKDDLAKTYMAACIRMGENMHLIGVGRYKAEQFDSMAPDAMEMLSYVAWGAFNFSTVYALHFHDLSSGTFTKFPPLLPRPGRPIFADGANITNRTRPAPPYFGVSFYYFCQFWCIAHNMAAVYYSSPGAIHQHVPMAFAESKFRNLLKWADDLPPECSRHEGMPHNVAEMHICYHATIMDVFRPFLAQELLLSSFSSDPKRPIAIFALASGHLKELTIYYHTSFAGTPAAHTISWVHGPLYIAPTILRYEKGEQRAAGFLACMQACTPLIESHIIMDGATKALFSLAVSAGVFDMVQAMHYLGTLTAKRAEDRLTRTANTGFVIDQDLAMESRVPAVGDALIQKFDEMVLFDDVTEGQ